MADPKRLLAIETLREFCTAVPQVGRAGLDLRDTAAEALQELISQLAWDQLQLDSFRAERVKTMESLNLLRQEILKLKGKFYPAAVVEPVKSPRRYRLEEILVDAGLVMPPVVMAPISEDENPDPVEEQRAKTELLYDEAADRLGDGC